MVFALVMVSAIFEGELLALDRGERIETVDKSENSFENEHLYTVKTFVSYVYITRRWLKGKSIISLYIQSIRQGVVSRSSL